MMDLNGDLIGLVIGFGLLRRGFVVDFVGSWYFCWIDRDFGAAALWLLLVVLVFDGYWAHDLVRNCRGLLVDCGCLEL